jgi:serine/threonine protein kinase
MLCPACQAENDDSAGLCFECRAPLSVIVKGSVLANRYEILKPLGRGGMGMVYLAHDRELDDRVALKLLRTDAGDSGDLARRFRSEIRLARRIAHKNVCRIFEYGQDGPRQFITMAYVDGVDLKRLLRERGPFPFEEAFDIAIRVAEALQAIHDEGIVHRDLKTPNIMLDARGVVHVMDFGIAKDLEGSGLDLTGTGGIVGSPDYVSPERWRGQKADVRSDVYALGVVTFELFTARLPFEADNLSALMWQHVNAEPGLDALPDPMRPVVWRALAKGPAQRFASASDMAEALREARAECLALGVPSAAPPRPAGRPAIPNPRGSAMALPRQAPEVESRMTAVPTLSPTGIPTGVRTRHGAATQPPPLPPHWSPPAAAATGQTGSAPARGRWVLGGSAAALGALALAATVWRLGTPAAQPSPLPEGRLEIPEPARPVLPPAAPAAAPAAAPGAAPAPTAATGALRLSAVPPADITIDGVRVTGPLHRIVLAPGTHLVRLENPGYRPIQRAVKIRAGETTRLEIDFAEDGVRRTR